MQFISTFLALAATASAATLVPRQQAFFVKSFQAACIPHSVRCTYSFNITSDPAVFPEGSHCEITLNGPDKLPAVTQAPCDNSPFKFDFKPQDGGLYLAASQPINSRTNQDYCHKIPADQLVTDNNGAVQTQRYTGPADFQVSIFECDRK